MPIGAGTASVPEPALTPWIDGAVAPVGGAGAVLVVVGRFQSFRVDRARERRCGARDALCFTDREHWCGRGREGFHRAVNGGAGTVRRRGAVVVRCGRRQDGLQHDAGWLVPEFLSAGTRQRDRAERLRAFAFFQQFWARCVFEGVACFQVVGVDLCFQSDPERREKGGLAVDLRWRRFGREADGLPGSGPERVRRDQTD